MQKSAGTGARKRATAADTGARKRATAADGPRTDGDRLSEYSAHARPEVDDEGGGGGGAKPGRAQQGPRSRGRGAARATLGRAVVAAACALVALFAVAVLWGGGGAGRVRAGAGAAGDDAAWLRSREQELQAALAYSFGGAAGATNATQESVQKVLLRRERQLLKGTIKRAVVFHFAGDLGSEQKREQTLGNFDKMTSAIERFVLGASKGQSALHLGKEVGEWQDLRKLVAAHLAKHPHAVIVLNRADEAPAERLYDLEDAFEMSSLQHDGGHVDCTGAIFILQTSLGADLSSHVCSGACTPEHRLFSSRAGRRERERGAGEGGQTGKTMTSALCPLCLNNPRSLKSGSLFLMFHLIFHDMRLQAHVSTRKRGACCRALHAHANVSNLEKQATTLNVALKTPVRALVES